MSIAKVEDFRTYLIFLSDIKDQSTIEIVQKFIDKYEKKYLNSVISVSLTKTIYEALELDPDRDNLDQIYKDLIYGKIVSIDSVDYDYEGILGGIVNYVAEKYIRGTMSKLTNEGVYKAQTTNGGEVNNESILATYYNNSVKVANNTYGFLYQFSDTYDDAHRNTEKLIDRSFYNF